MAPVLHSPEVKQATACLGSFAKSCIHLQQKQTLRKSVENHKMMEMARVLGVTRHLNQDLPLGKLLV